MYEFAKDETPETRARDAERAAEYNARACSYDSTRECYVHGYLPRRPCGHSCYGAFYKERCPQCMSEPIYEYIRGQGWQPMVHKTFSGVTTNGKWKVTLIRRVPEAGEHFFSDIGDHNIDQIGQDLLGWVSPSSGGVWDKGDTEKWNMGLLCVIKVVPNE